MVKFVLPLILLFANSLFSQVIDFDSIFVHINIGGSHTYIDARSNMNILKIQDINARAAHDVIRQNVFQYEPFQGMETTIGVVIDYMNHFGIQYQYLKSGLPLLDDPEYQTSSSTFSYYYNPYSESMDTINVVPAEYSLFYSNSRFLTYVTYKSLKIYGGYEKCLMDITPAGDTSIPYVGYLINEGNELKYRAFLIGLGFWQQIFTKKIQTGCTFISSPYLNSVDYYLYKSSLKRKKMLYNDYTIWFNYTSDFKITIRLFTNLRIMHSDYVNYQFFNNGILISYYY